MAPEHVEGWLLAISVVKKETSMRYRFTLANIGKKKKKNSEVLMRTWRNWNSPALLSGK